MPIIDDLLSMPDAHIEDWVALRQAEDLVIDDLLSMPDAHLERYTPKDWERLRQAEDLVAEFERIIRREEEDAKTTQLQT